MKRSVVWFVIALALILSGVPAAAMASPPAQDPGWFAEYYANHDLAGAPALTRYEPSIDFSWGTGSPSPMVPVDQFSARFTRHMTFEAGTYSFCVTADDGVRFWVDGQLLIDEWRVTGTSQTYCASPYLSAGKDKTSAEHVLQVAYFEDTGNACLKLVWSGPIPAVPSPGPGVPWPPSPGQGWVGEYYDDMVLGATASPAKPPIMVRMDPQINFNWGENGPAVGLPAYEFSVRWTRDVDLPAGNYNFCATVDDGVRVWVDGQLILDEWREQSIRTFCAPQNLAAGKHTLQVAYLQKRGEAIISFSYSTGNAPAPVPPPAPQPIPNPQPVPQPIPYPQPVPQPIPYPQPVPQPIPYPQPMPQPGPYPQPMPQPGPYPQPMPQPGPYPQPVPYPTPPSQYAGTGWNGEYFNNNSLSGPPVLTRVDPEINFDWGWGSPAPAIPPDDFSVRWTRDDWYDANVYTFCAKHDDGVRLYLDGGLVIDAWFEQAAAVHCAPVPVNAGMHRVVVEYYEHTQFALISVWRTTGGQPAPQPTPPPTPPPAPPPPPAPVPPPYPGNQLIVDNTDPGFIWGGSSSSRNVAYLGFGGHTFWTYNSNTDPINYGKWMANLAPGYYEVFAFVPSQYATTTRARYRVLHGWGQRDDRVVNQSVYNDQWVSLGTYYFTGNGNEFVLLYDNTREPYGSAMIAFDAIKFAPRW